jgi:phospholipid/cholesterol/gamma-HCH transport system substrate-binding protein
METRAHHILIGAFTLLAIAFGFGFVLWLSQGAGERANVLYDVEFTEAISGLGVGGTVQFNGIKVGEVAKLLLDPNDPKKVIARIEVGPDTPVKVDTKATLSFQGLTGIALISLTGGSATSAPLVPTKQHPIPKIEADTSALQKLMTSSEDIITNVNDVILRLSKLVRQENIDRIEATLANAESFSAALAAESANVAEASRALRATLAHAEQLAVKLERLTTEADRLLSGDGKAMIASAREAAEAAKRFAEGAATMVETNSAAIARFSNQGLSQVGPALAELRATLRNFKELVDEIEEDPGEFVLGRDQPQEYDPK